MSALDNLDAADALEPSSLSGLQKLDMADEESPAAAHSSMPLSKTARFMQGLTDLPAGLGQLSEHMAEKPLNWLRHGIRSALNAAGQNSAADLFQDVSTKDFDQIIAQREQNYQQARAAAQQGGVDWWRLGGNIANPLNYAGPGAAETVAGRIGQAATQGAALGAATPSTRPGNFWADKLTGTAVGGATGAATAGLIEAAIPGIRAGVKMLKGTAQPSIDAEHVVNETLKAGGIDPNTVDLNVLKTLRQEAQESLQHDVVPSATVMANRAQAESLPVPVELTRGQAARDPFLYAKELNQRGWEGVGEPIAERLTDQNRRLIANLDVMGAKDAPDPVSAGSTLISHIQTVDAGLKSKINAAYDAVKNSQGQSASLDGITAADNIRKALGEDYEFLHPKVRSAVESLLDGSPLTVERAQALDKAWSGLQSGAPMSTTEDRAIEIAKKTLLDAPLDEAVGAQSIQAYQAAKGLAKQRFGLIDANPAYKAILREQRSADPDKFFQSFVTNGTAREIQGLQKLTAAADPGAPELIGKTLLGEIKRRSLNGSDDAATFSQAKFSKFVTDPVWRAKLGVTLPSQVNDTLERLNQVAQTIQRAPVASAVNRSNTTSAAFNAAQDVIKAGAGEQLLGKLGSKLPGFSTASQAAAAAAKTGRLQKAVQQSLNPGVTEKVLPALTPPQRESAGIALRALLPLSLYGVKESTDE